MNYYMNGAPLTRTPPRQSWGPRAVTLGGWRRIQARWSTCLLLLAVQRRRVESMVLGALFHHRQYTPCSCVGVLGINHQHSGVYFCTTAHGLGWAHTTGGSEKPAVQRKKPERGEGWPT